MSAGHSSLGPLITLTASASRAVTSPFLVECDAELAELRCGPTRCRSAADKAGNVVRESQLRGKEQRQAISSVVVTVDAAVHAPVCRHGVAVAPESGRRSRPWFRRPHAAGRNQESYMPPLHVRGSSCSWRRVASLMAAKKVPVLIQVKCSPLCRFHSTAGKHKRPSFATARALLQAARAIPASDAVDRLFSVPAVMGSTSSFDFNQPRDGPNIRARTGVGL
jgi:hypothetical protein